MPSKDELSEQLGLTTKLAAQVERMALAAEKLEASYSAQTQTLTQLAQAIGAINVQNLTQGINGLNDSLKTMQSNMEKAGKSGEQNFKKLGKGVLDASKNFADKFPKAAAVATGALTGFYQGIKNVVAMSKGIAGFATSFVDGLANITASILAIPIKIFSGLIDMAAQSAGGSNELMQALENLRKEFGAFYAPTNKAIIDTTKNLTGFKDTGLSAWRVFGNMADRLKYIGELAKDMGGAFSKLREEMETNGGAILAYQKGLGLAGEDMKAVTMRSVSMGKKTSDNLKDMTKYSYELGEAFGLDAKLISRDMGKALGDVAHFGGATVKQLGEASTYARKLGLELKDITGTLDAFDTFDTAAENAAKLSQSMGVQIDAFEMMKAQSPAEQLDMLRKSFAKAGVDASQFNRAQLKLVASTTGLDEATVQSALSMKNQGLSMDQIQKKSAMAEKKTMTQAEAMGKLADAIERMVQSGGGMEGGFWAMFVKGIKNGLMSSKEFYTMMREIQIALRQVYMEGVKLGKELVDLVPGFKELFGGLVKVFNPRAITDLFKGIREAVEKFFGKNDDPENPEKGSLPALVKHLQEIFFHFFDREGDGAKEMMSGFKKFFKFMAELAGQGLKLMGHVIAEGAKGILAYLTGDKKIEGVGGAVSGGLGFLKEIIDPIIDGLKSAWEEMKEPLKALAQKVWEMLKDFLWDHKGILIKGIGLMLMTAFGPAVTRSLLGVGINILGKGIKDMLFGAVKKGTEGMEGIAEKVAGGGGGLLSKIIGPIMGNPYVAAAAAIAALGVVGTGFSKGVEKFKDKIAKDIGDDTDKKVGAATAGLVQLLSFGSLSDEAAQGMAESFAKYSEQFNKVVEKIFGKDFAKDLRAMMTNTFDKLIDIGDFFRSLFSGDISGAVKALGKLLWDIGTGAIMQLKMVFLTIPEKLLTWLSDGITALTDWLDSLFQPDSDGSVIDSLIDGLKSIGEYVLPLVSDIPERLLTLLGNKLVPALLRITGTLLGLLERIPAKIFELISDAFKYLFGSDNWASKYIFDPVANALYEVGNAIPFFFKYLGNAISSGIDWLKAKAKGEDTSKIQVFPNIGDEYDKYKAALKTTTKAVVDDNKNAQQQIADASKAPGGPGAEKTDVGGFLHKATETVEDLAKVKGNLAKVTEKDLQAVKDQFAKVFTMFGDEKQLAENVAKSDSISKAFGALSNIATSAVNISTVVSGDKVKNLEPALVQLQAATSAVRKMVTDKDMVVPAEAIANIANVGKAFESVQQVGNAFKDMSDAVVKATGNIKAGGIAPALEAVQKMVKVANDLNDALADGKLNKIDVKAKLENVAKAVGLGGKATYTVNPSKAIQITVNMEVTMDVDKVEKVMILRQGSIIRDRLDFAGTKPQEKIDNPLNGYTREDNIPPPHSAGAG